MLITVTLAALLSHTPATTAPAVKADAQIRPIAGKPIAVDLHPMSDDEKRLYPGRERFDKIEWYESQMKGVKAVVIPDHVDDWNNGGLDLS